MFLLFVNCFCCQFTRLAFTHTHTHTHTHTSSVRKLKCRRMLFQPLLTTDLRELKPNTHSLPSINSHLAVCAWIMAASSPIESCWSGCFWPGSHVWGVLKPLTFHKLGDGVCESLNVAGQVPRILLDLKPQFLGAVELRLHVLMKLCPKTITGSLESNVQDQTDYYTKLKNTHLSRTQDPVEWDQ